MTQMARPVSIAWSLKLPQAMLAALLLCSCYLSCPAQSTWQQWKSLSRPVQMWTIGHLGKARLVQRISLRAIALADSMAGQSCIDQNGLGGSKDAFRHGIWMVLLVQKLRPKAAADLGEAYEKGNYQAFQRRHLEDGGIQDAAASAMDRYNNAMGRQLGIQSKHSPEATLIRAVRDGIAQGKFRMILQDQQGNALDSLGQIIPQAEWLGRWENARRLRPTRCWAQ